MKKCFSLTTFWLLLFAGQRYALAFYTPEGAALAQQFISQSTNPQLQKQYLWLTPQIQAQIQAILGHRYPKIRLPYWQHQNKNTFIWVLEEKGKDLPITVGIVIKDQKIDQLRILKFRESRGWEVKYPSFTQQFNHAQIKQNQLSKQIDGISGATLSVNAVKKLAKLALILTHEVENKK